MQLVLHAGSHFTEEGRVLKCLLRNKDILHKRGTVVPGPGRYRDLLRDTVVAMSGTKVSPDARTILLDAIIDNETSERIILSHPHLFGWPRAAIRQGLFYPQAADRMAKLADIFEGDELELFMAVRNPATFIPNCFARNPRDDIDAFLGGFDPRQLRWSDTFALIRDAVPDLSIIVWCYEDAPLLWSQIIRELGGLEHGAPVIGQFDLAREIMSQEGADRFVSYLNSKTDMTEMHTRRVIAAFLEQYAMAEKIEEEVDLPGFTAELISELTEIYEDDTSTLSRMPGVEMITL